MSSNGIKNYTESNTLLQYQGKIELGPDDPSYLSQKKNENSNIDSNPSLSETLNAMFLPREWEENGKKFIQYVSPEPATREKARDLFKALDEKIKERQAREKGICPVREELYSQCFDEIIRQVTIEFFDGEGSGFIDINYFKKAITSFGYKISEEDFNNIIDKVITDNSGKKFDYKDLSKIILEMKK